MDIPANENIIAHNLPASVDGTRSPYLYSLQYGVRFVAQNIRYVCYHHLLFLQ